MSNKPFPDPWTSRYICICAFLISIGMNFTRVPIVHAFRTMICDDYYERHAPYTGNADRCSFPEIEASTARAVSVLGATITINGVLNLIFANWTMRRFGLKSVLVQQLIGPTIRLLFQMAGIRKGGQSGILIIQISQLLGVVGGSTGYVLILTNFISRCVESSAQTNAFGKLQGSIMLGTAVAYLTGGTISTKFGISVAFITACAVLVISIIYSIILMPQLAAVADVEEEDPGAFKKIVAPLQVLVSTNRADTGSTSYNRPLLGAGVFIGVLATGFIPILLQMHATNNFGFTSQDNGYLIATTFGVRSLFLTVVFPVIINFGRKGISNRARKTSGRTAAGSGEEPYNEASPLLQKQATTASNREFDVWLLSVSFFLDAFLTAATAWCHEAWQLFLAATLLPLASGSAPAAKGVIVGLVQPRERSDALAGIAMLELLATVCSMSAFGAVFSALASIGRTNLVFLINGGLALLAGFITVFVRLPLVKEVESHSEE